MHRLTPTEVVFFSKPQKTLIQMLKGIDTNIPFPANNLDYCPFQGA
jgi:hypothetical protein